MNNKEYYDDYNWVDELNQEIISREELYKQNFIKSYDKLLNIRKTHESNLKKINSLLDSCNNELKYYKNKLKIKNEEIASTQLLIDLNNDKQYLIKQKLDDNTFYSMLIGKLNDEQKSKIKKIKNDIKNDKNTRKLLSKLKHEIKILQNEREYIVNIINKLSDGKVKQVKEVLKKQNAKVKSILEKIEFNNNYINTLKSYDQETYEWFMKYDNNHRRRKNNAENESKNNKKYKFNNYHDNQLKTMPYSEYLQTEHWKTVRRQVMKRDKFKCVKCNCGDSLQVHHLTYERRGNENLDDLITVCKDCHEEIHGLSTGKTHVKIKNTNNSKIVIYDILKLKQCKKQTK